MPFTKCEYIIAWFYRESICFYLFLKAASNPTVKWREGKYLLKWGSRAVKIEDKNSANTPTKASPVKSMLSEQEAALLPNNNGSIKKNKILENITTVPETAGNSPVSASSSAVAATLPVKTQHKRNSSYSIANKATTYNNNNNSNHQYSNSDLENSHTPYLNSTQALTSNHFNNKISDQSQLVPSQFSNSKTPLNYIRSHQHHHSISSFMITSNSAAQNNSSLSNSTTEIPLSSKFN